MPIRFLAGASLLLAGLMLVGCAGGPSLLPADQQTVIDRALVEYPAGFELKPLMRGLTAPSAIALDEARGVLLVAESGVGGNAPRIMGIKLHPSEGENPVFDFFPKHRRLPIDFLNRGFDLHAPIGGMAVSNGEVFVSHRDRGGRGVITAFDYDGRHRTVVANLPAMGDHAVTDLAIHPTTGRLYFGLGSATNSGVVGIDNFAVGWARKHPNFADRPASAIKLLGYKFFTPNPDAGLFGGSDIAVTAPFHPFGKSNQLRIKAAEDGKPTAAIYSISPGGGDLRLVAQGLRHPRGLAFSEFGNLFATNNGMEMRGTRPVKDDPDALLRVVANTDYGWPDYSADLVPISHERFQPPADIITRSGYPEVSAVVDRDASSLSDPASFKETLLFAVFPSLSGAAKMAFVPSDARWEEFRGDAVVCLSGDRAPFATSGRKLVGPIGYRVVRVNLDSKQVRPFLHNTSNLPASRMKKGSPEALERPIDAKFASDGTLYVLDFGGMEMRDGRERVRRGTGQIFRLQPVNDTANHVSQ